MNDSREETASLYVLDQLTPAERARFEAELALDPALAALVRDYEAALAAGVRSLPQRQPSASLRQRIEREIEAETDARWSPTAGRAQRARPSSSRVTLPWIAFAKWGIAAVITVSLATLAIQSLRPPATQPVFVVVGLDANHSTFAELPSPAAQDPDTRFIQLASAAEDLWRNPAARPLPTPTAPADNRGYALFDPTSQQGFIAIEQLPALPRNQQYHLWVMDEKSGRIRDAGILPLAGLNRGLYSFALDPAEKPAKERARPNFFITVEDATATPNPAKPSGRVVLGRESI